jgi:hypothetical protein
MTVLTSDAPPTCQMSATNKMAAVISCAGMCLVRAAAIAGKASSSYQTRTGHSLAELFFKINFLSFQALFSLQSLHYHT